MVQLNPRPHPKHLDATASIADKPPYQTWYHQPPGQMVLSSVSTLEEEVLPHILTLTSSRDVWITLDNLFSAHSQARMVQTMFQLTSLHKSENNKCSKPNITKQLTKYVK
jgi:hypothetical protein